MSASHQTLVLPVPQLVSDAGYFLQDLSDQITCAQRAHADLGAMIEEALVVQGDFTSLPTN